VVATALGGPAETVRDGVTGALVAPEDARALAAALRLRLEDRERAEREGQAGRAEALAAYSDARVLDTVERVHREIAGPRRAG
jgi:glycosyltransferase involved in cell wall biosynthesis